MANMVPCADCDWPTTNPSGYCDDCEYYYNGDEVLVAPRDVGGSASAFAPGESASGSSGCDGDFCVVDKGFGE